MKLIVLTPSLRVLADGFPFFALLPSAFFPVISIMLCALVVLILWMVWRRQRSPSKGALPADNLPEGVSVIPRSVLSKGEATLLNLIRLAVQDSYLVFAKLPVSNIVMVTDAGQEIQKMILRTIQAVRVDVALIHPGTLCPAKVIQFVSNGEPPFQPSDRDRLVNAVLHAAGIEIIRVEPHTTYTVAKLVELLGLGEEE